MYNFCVTGFSAIKKITAEEVLRMLLKIANENESVYASYINLLTPFQFRVLRAVAINGGVQNHTSGDFISRYGLGAASSVSLVVKSLQDKEFIDLIDGKYVLNDMFLGFWLNYKSGTI